MQNKPTSSRARPLWFSKKFWLIGASLWTCGLHAQQGVAPSQNEMFFDDLRARTVELDGSEVTTGSRPGLKPIYTFDGYGYTEDGQGHYSSYGDDEKLFGYPVRQGTDRVYSQRYGRQPSRYTDPLVFRNSYFAPTYVTDPFAQSGNIRLGGVTVGLGLGSYFEYTDNWNRAGRDTGNEQDQFTMGVNLSANIDYQMSKYNRFSLNLGGGYDFYGNDADSSGRGGDEFAWYAAPGSSLVYDFRLGSQNLYVTVYDRWSISQVVDDEFTLDDYEMFSRFENDLGVGLTWLINSQWNFSMNYNWGTTIALDDDFSFADRNVYSLSANLTYSPEQTWSVGLSASTSWNDYTENFNNDGQSYSVGAFASVPITRFLDLRVGGGFQDMMFDDGGTSGDGNDLNDWYANASLRHQINSRISHSLSWGHESTLNYTSNFVTTDYVNYGVGIIAWKGSMLNLSYYLEQENESGGVLEEDLKRAGVDINYTYYLRRDLMLNFGYRFGVVDSDLSDRDYKDHQFSVDFNYLITKHIRLGVGYRYTTSDAQDELESYDQNRLFLNLNYNF